MTENGSPTILHISESWGGGVAEAVSRYAYILPEYTHLFAYRTRAGSETKLLPNLVQGKSKYFSFLINAIVEIMARPDAIIFLHSSHAGLIRAIFPFRKKVYYFPHCFAFERLDLSSSMRGFLWVAEKILGYSRSKIACLSPRELELARGISKNKVIQVCNFSVNPAKNISIPTNVKLIVSVGRICNQKDPEFFAEVAEILRGTASFTWVGDGDANLKKILLDAGVVVTGWVSTDKVDQLVSGADLYFHSALWEGSPLSTLDAISLGVPVITREIPSMASLNYFVAGQIPKEVADSISRLGLEEKLSIEISKLSQAVVENNSAFKATNLFRKALGEI